MVTVYGYLSWSGHTGTGFMEISGLPFASNAQVALHPTAAIGYPHNISLTAGNVVTAFGAPGASTISLYQYPTGGGANSAVPMDASGDIMFSITYSI